MTEPEEAVAQSCVAILRSPRFDRIHVTLQGFTVSPAGLREVASAIECGSLRVMQARLEDFYAVYDLVQDIIWIDPEISLTDLDGIAVVYHEAIHALQDIQRSTLSSADSEVIAYLAESAFCVQNEGLAAMRTRASTTGGPWFRRMNGALLNLVERYDIGTRPVVLPTTDVDVHEARISFQMSIADWDAREPFPIGAFDGISKTCRHTSLKLKFRSVV